jgi:hypothetical protein
VGVGGHWGMIKREGVGCQVSGGRCRVAGLRS